jgi:hypothetical protein
MYRYGLRVHKHGTAPHSTAQHSTGKSRHNANATHTRLDG